MFIKVHAEFLCMRLTASIVWTDGQTSMDRWTDEYGQMDRRVYFTRKKVDNVALCALRS
jgi:hypothetical protein